MRINDTVILSEAKDPDLDSSAFGLRMTFLIIFLFLPFGFKNLFAENTGMDVSARITRLIQQVDELEKKQQQTLVDQSDILEQINNLKIQVRR